MKLLLASTIFCSILGSCLFNALAQPSDFKVSNAHSHNDYENNIPFLRAYKLGFGSIEADVFPVGGKLLVAHDKKSISADRTLKGMYLDPALRELSADTSRTLSLLIDVKEDYPTSLALLVNELQPLGNLLTSQRLKIVISGNRPEPGAFRNYPTYLQFDDDQSHASTSEQWKRVAMVSLPFSKFSKWNGKGRIVKEEAERLKWTIDSVHAAGKRIRFWDAPDGPTAWLALMELGADLIGTDMVEDLGAFLLKSGANSYRSNNRYPAYKPTYKSDGSDQKVKNIILCIGDGMGLTHLYAAYTSNGAQLNIFGMRNIGFSLTSAADAYGTDSAAGATAMATGEKTNNRAIGVDANGKPLKSLLDFSQEAGKKTALIAITDITDATPAAFYAHVKDRSQIIDIAVDLASVKADIIVGSGLMNFRAPAKGANSLEILRKRGYEVVDSFAGFIASPSPSIAAILNEDQTRPVMNGRGAFLSDAFLKVTETFASHKNGFFVMMEGSQIDQGGHANNLQQLITENRDFDQAVGEALRFADNNKETLVIVTADHETGGLTLLDGNFKAGSIKANFSTTDHTGIPVPVFAYGPHSGDFRGVYENNELFKKILILLKASGK